jgi:hypothetical protein
MSPEPLSDPNKALLAGEIAGALMQVFESARPEVDGQGDYTGRTLIDRPSGTWAVSVELVEP